MFSRVHLRYLFLLLVLGALALSGQAVAVEDGPLTVRSIETLGVVTFPTGYQFRGTEVGGLSGIAYDSHRHRYYVVSDDDVPRYYTVAIDVADGSLDPGDVTFLDVTFLRDHPAVADGEVVTDVESIVMVQPGKIYISAEGDLEAMPAIPPVVDRFNPSGRQNRTLPIPEKFLPGGANSARDNLVFESLTARPDRDYLYTATENALVADGPISSLSSGSPARVLQIALNPLLAGAEYVYHVEPLPFAPVPAGEFADNGLVELEALDNHGTFLAMERSYAVGVGNTVRLFETSTEGATDVATVEVLGAPDSYEPMPKRLLADFEADLGVDPDNLEGMRFGPTLPDGRRVLIVVSDNNFRGSQTTQFVALAVELEAAD